MSCRTPSNDQHEFERGGRFSVMLTAPRRPRVRRRKAASSGGPRNRSSPCRGGSPRRRTDRV